MSTMLLSLLRSGVAAAAMILPVRYIAAQVDWLAAGQLSYKVLMLGCAVGAGVVAYAAAAFVLGGPEVDGAKRIVRRRFKRP
jgi:hypothetical protein